MGGLVGKIKQSMHRFNIENRANNVISSSKIIPAPKYAATIKQLKVAQELNPHFLKKHYEKDFKFDEQLKNVYVTSTETKMNTLDQPNPDRPLPTSRTSEDFEFGFYMPDSVPVGKLTLKDIFQIIIEHKEDSVKNSSNILATKYKLDEETIEKLLDYYKLYQLVLPKQKVDKKFKFSLDEIKLFTKEFMQLKKDYEKEQAEIKKLQEIADNINKKLNK
ncbi:protein NDUFAF4 homolog [Vespa mandarinia]|uniref:protein NDUFAF4 homolog n=1 Tax=Vespa mandarinia TaxID=7446 RepID=UPI0016135A8C|nr:protein NDUFAF4 homolog [Vespa mandarinia]XP_035731675.1 protein NDUFAF4 homolog [Vespa mandarinia]